HGLSFVGNVDTRAPTGHTGSLLLDPDFISVVDGVATTGDQDITLVTGLGTIAFGAANTTNNTLSVGEINAQGATTTVSVNAGEIRFNNTTNITMGSGNSISFAADNSQPGATGGNNTIQNTGAGTFSITTSGAGTVSLTAGGL